jgi:hypothetical protein
VQETGQNVWRSNSVIASDEKRAHLLVTPPSFRDLLSNDDISLGKEREGYTRGRANKTKRTRVFWQWRCVLNASCYKKHGLRGVGLISISMRPLIEYTLFFSKMQYVAGWLIPDLSPWEREGKRASHSFATLHPDLPSLLLDDLRGQIDPQSQACCLGL